jgi:hypothetical protein
MIGNKSGLGLECFGRLVMGDAGAKMENISSGGESIAWCD